MKILFLDLETFPNVAYIWGAYEQNAIEMREDWYILSYAAKWLGSRRIETLGLNDCGQGKLGNHVAERGLMKRVHALIDDADIVVAHNGVDFDIRVANTRMLVHGLNPPSPYKTVDTKRAIKQAFRFSSNKLDWLCKQLGIGRKIEHEGFPLWKGCAAGDAKSWAKMKRYNRHDVRLLEELYLLVAPWIKQPNAAVFANGQEQCVNPACRINDITFRGLHRTQTRVYRRFVCKCGKWGRSVSSEKAPKAKVVPIA